MIDRETFAQIGLKPLEDVKNGASAVEYRLKTTSGTSGKPIFFASQVGRDSFVGPLFTRVLVLRGTVSSRFGNAHYGALNEIKGWGAGSERLTLGPDDFHADLPRLLSDFAPTGIITTPGLLLRMLSQVPGSAEALSNCTAVELSGEVVTEDIYARLRALLPSVQFRGAYGCVEVGVIGISACGHLPPNLFHPFHGECELKIVNEDAQGVGDILVSKRIGRDVFIEEYKIGDSGRYIKSACACGDPTTFEVLGRTDLDWVKAGGAVFTMHECSRVAELLKEYIVDAQFSVRERIDQGIPKAELEVEIVPTGMLGTLQEGEALVAHAIAEHYRATPTRSVAQLITAGDMLPIVVRYTTVLKQGAKRRILAHA